MMRKITLFILLFLGVHTLHAQDVVVISITSGQDTACTGSPVTFTALSNDVTATYQWFVNSQATGITTDTFASSALVNDDTVTCQIYYINAGHPDSTLSNAIVVYRYPYTTADVSIALTNGYNPGCPQSELTFTASNLSASFNPVFQWYVNNNPIGGATDSTYTSSSFNNGDSVSCMMISNTPCSVPDTAFSNKIGVIRATEPISILISANPNPVCQGHNVLFTTQTSVNVGFDGNYQWYVNSNLINGATNTTFVDTFNNGDIVYCTLIDHDPCVSSESATSNTITIAVNPSIVPSIQAAIIQGNNPGCLDSTIVFAGTSTNFGSDTSFVWLVNGDSVATGDTFSTNLLVNNDTVVLRVTNTDTTTCYRWDTLYSQPIVMALDTTQFPPLLSLIGDHIIGNDTGTYLWYGPNGYISGDSSFTYHPLVLGQYYARLLTNGCLSAPSNILNISLLDAGLYSLDQVKIYPNPTNGIVNLDWGTQNVNMKIDVFSVSGQGVLHEEINGQSRKTINMSDFPDGNYYMQLTNNDGTSATVKITLAK